MQGEIRTTVEYLVQLLETEEFKANTIDTSWLDGLIREKVTPPSHFDLVSPVLFVPGRQSFLYTFRNLSCFRFSSGYIESYSYYNSESYEGGRVDSAYEAQTGAIIYIF